MFKGIDVSEKYSSSRVLSCGQLFESQVTPRFKGILFYFLSFNLFVFLYVTCKQYIGGSFFFFNPAWQSLNFARIHLYLVVTETAGFESTILVFIICLSHLLCTPLFSYLLGTAVLKFPVAVKLCPNW